MALPFSSGHSAHLVDSNLAAFGTASNPIFTSVTGAGSGGTSSVDETAFTAASSAGTALMGVTTPTSTGLAANLLAIAALDANRNLCVNIKAGSGSGVSVTDSAAWTAASSVFVPNGGVFNDSATALTSGQQGTVRSTAQRAIHINLRNNSGTEIGTLAAPVRTDPTGTTTQPISGTVTANAGTGTFPDQHTDVQLDYDTGAGTQNLTIFGIALPASGGAVAGGTASNPIQVSLANTGANSTAVKVDGSAVTQPVSGTVTANQGGTWTVQPGNTANTTPWLVTQTPATSGGLSIYRLLSAASTNANSVKGSAGQVFGFIITNTNAAARFVKLYNKASAPTVGTDTPVMTLVIPGNANGSGMVAAEFTNGIAFGTGISIAITGAVTDADTTAVAANEVVVNLMYK